jgi:5'-nucleotidase
MRILVSNDDGVDAPGIKALAKELSLVATIELMAPDRNRSAASNSLTLMKPLRASKLENGFISVQGTPTDCVHLGITGFIDPKPDMVVSGINAGANLGDDVIYSGTVAAASEGRVLGLPSVAVSLVGKDPQMNYDTAAVVARQIVERLKKEALPPETILNVNVPDIGIEEIQGFELTRLGKRHKAQPAIKAIDPRGYPLYWIGASGKEEDAGEGTDFHAVNANKVSITPIQIDMTNYSVLKKMDNWASGLVLCKQKEHK